MQQRSRVLLLPVNDTPNVLGIVPGKIFEYLAAQRPVLVIGTEEGDSARIVRETGAGIICGFKEKERMKTEVMNLFNNRDNLSSFSVEGIQKYSRRQKAKEMAALLQAVSK